MNSDTAPQATVSGGSDFDGRGVPTSLAVAKTLTQDHIVILARRVICDLEGITDQDIDAFDTSPTDGSPLIESQLGVFVFNELTQHLSAKTISVAGIEEWQWSTIDGLATAVFVAVNRLKA